MRILFVTERMPFPLHNGNAILTWHTLEFLSRRHRVEVIAYPATTAGDDPLKGALARTYIVPSPRVRGRRLRQFASLFGTRGAIESTYRDEKFERVVADVLAREEYDVVVVDHLRMGWLAPTILGKRRSAAVVFRSHNCEADVRRLYMAHAPAMWKPALALEHRKTRAYEERVVGSVDSVIAVTAEDAELHRRQGAARVFHVPPGCDFREARRRGERDRIPGSIVLMGSFEYLAKEINAVFLLREVLPRVREQIPGARLFLVGAGPSARLRRIAAAANGVTVTGRVADAHAITGQCEVFVMPTVVGGGFELKGLEAIGMRIPIAATPLARRGLEVTPGKCISIGASHEELAARIIDLLRDGEARSRQAQAAYDEAVAMYEWDVVGSRFESVLKKSAERAPSAPDVLAS